MVYLVCLGVVGNLKLVGLWVEPGNCYVWITLTGKVMNADIGYEICVCLESYSEYVYPLDLSESGDDEQIRRRYENDVLIAGMETLNLGERALRSDFDGKTDYVDRNDMRHNGETVNGVRLNGGGVNRDFHAVQGQYGQRPYAHNVSRREYFMPPVAKRRRLE